MKMHLVTLHCGEQILARNPGQRFCNKKCLGYFVSRRPGTKKRNLAITFGEGGSLRRAGHFAESSDPVWVTKARPIITSRGYVEMIFWSPELSTQFRRMEHIIVWELLQGKQVPRGFVIHHINEQKEDNEPSNLVALPRRLHRELHVQLKHLAEECTGVIYIVRRHQLTQGYLKRVSGLEDLRKRWNTK